MKIGNEWVTLGSQFTGVLKFGFTIDVQTLGSLLVLTLLAFNNHSNDAPEQRDFHKGS